MPYKKIIPVSDVEMRRERYVGHNTVCQTLREIYAACSDPEVRFKCRKAMAMAKSMHNRLKEYSQREAERNGNIALPRPSDCAGTADEG